MKREREVGEDVAARGVIAETIEICKSIYGGKNCINAVEERKLLWYGKMNLSSITLLSPVNLPVLPLILPPPLFLRVKLNTFRINF